MAAAIPACGRSGTGSRLQVRIPAPVRIISGGSAAEPHTRLCEVETTILLTPSRSRPPVTTPHSRTCDRRNTPEAAKMTAGRRTPDAPPRARCHIRKRLHPEPSLAHEGCLSTQSMLGNVVPNDRGALSRSVLQKILAPRETLGNGVSGSEGLEGSLSLLKGAEVRFLETKFGSLPEAYTYYFEWPPKLQIPMHTTFSSCHHPLMFHQNYFRYHFSITTYSSLSAILHFSCWEYL